MGLATSEFRAVVLALASAGASILGPFCWVAVFRGRGFGPRTAALLLAVGCLLYAGACSLGFNAGVRQTATAAVLERSEAAADRRSVMLAARTELASLATAKPSRAILERRRELAKLLATPAPETKPVAVQADPQAASLAFIMRAFGWPVSDQEVGQWLGLASVLFLELCAALSLTVAVSLRPTRPKPATAPQTAVPAGPPEVPAAPEKPATARRDDEDQDRSDPPAPPSRSRRKGGRPTTVLPSDVLDKIKAKGGKLSGSLAGIGRDIGVAKTSLHRVLRGLAEQGRLTVATGPRGVMVALV
jgi:hypothetical protein